MLIPVETVVLTGSKDLQIIFVSSFLNLLVEQCVLHIQCHHDQMDLFLNPFDTNALLPKLELELVIDCSPPDSDKK